MIFSSGLGSALYFAVALHCSKGEHNIDTRQLPKQSLSEYTATRHCVWAGIGIVRRNLAGGIQHFIYRHQRNEDISQLYVEYQNSPEDTYRWVLIT